MLGKKKVLVSVAGAAAAAAVVGAVVVTTMPSAQAATRHRHRVLVGVGLDSTSAPGERGYSYATLGSTNYGGASAPDPSGNGRAELGLASTPKTWVKTYSSCQTSRNRYYGTGGTKHEAYQRQLNNHGCSY